MPSARPCTLGRVALAALLALLVVVAAAPAARAAGTPDLALTKEARDSLLLDAQQQVTLRVASASGQPRGFNLAFSDVLPAGVSYVAGSTTGTTVQPRVLANTPAAGQTTLVWSDVGDLTGGATLEIGYGVRHDSTFTVGGTYLNRASVFANTDARTLVKFAADGTALPASYTGSAQSQHTTTLTALEVEKHEDSPEGEILRGAHEFQTVFRIDVRNSSRRPTSAVSVDDWLPAGLEFLGCATTDATTNAPGTGGAAEYPGAPSLAAGADVTTGCLAPALVETVTTDPDLSGPLPSGVYTHVRWTLSAPLAAGGSAQLRYAAAVPLRENTTAWRTAGGTPAVTGTQTANLDNNTGPETHDEQPLRSHVRAAGTFDATTATSATATHLRTAEDLRVVKSASRSDIAQGTTTTWTLRTATGEYRHADDVTVTDTVPDGLCPLGTTNLDASDPGGECAPADAPSPAFTSASEQADGRWTLTWQLGRVLTGQERVVTFQTRARRFRQQGGADDTANPVAARDTWTNTVSVTGVDKARCLGGATPCAEEDRLAQDEDETGADVDASSASQTAGGPELETWVAAAPSPADCPESSWVGPGTTEEQYGPGDRVCYRVRMEFPAGLDTRDAQIEDLLPPGMTLEGPYTALPDHTATIASFDDATPGVAHFDLAPQIPAGAVFDVTLAARVGPQTPDRFAKDVVDGLAKAVYVNTDGRSFPLRARVGLRHDAPRLALAKAVTKPDAAALPATVNGGDVLRYALTLSGSEGTRTARDAVVHEELPPGATCADVGALPPELACEDLAQDRLVWTAGTVTPTTPATTAYTVTLPTTFAPNQAVPTTAVLQSFTTETNEGDPTPPFLAGVNFPATTATASVRLEDLVLGATRAPQNVTIGEDVEHVLTLTLPAGTTLGGSPVLREDVTSRLVLGTPTATRGGGALPAGVSGPVVTGNLVELRFGTSYATGGADEVFVLRIPARVADVAANTRTSGATLGVTPAFASALPTRTATLQHTVHEPNLALARSDDDADDVVKPGDEVAVTLSVTNPTAPGRVSPAHDAVLVETLAPALTPVDLGGATWDAGARTLSWPLGDHAAGGAAQARTYRVRVEPLVGASSLQSSALARATSRPGTVTGERTTGAGYAATSTGTFTAADPALTRAAASPARPAVGALVTHALTLRIPASLTVFDDVVEDVLPDGLAFHDVVGATCVAGCPVGDPAVTPLAPVAGAGGTTRVRFDLGDRGAHGAEREIVLTYRARVEDEGGVAAGTQLTTGATNAFNRTDGDASTRRTTAVVPASVTVAEPAVALTTLVDGQAARATQPAAGHAFTVTVTNSGLAAAHDVLVEARPHALLRDVESPEPSTWDAAARRLRWTLPSLAPGATAVLHWTATVPAGTAVHDGQALASPAQTLEHRSLAGGGRTYAAGAVGTATLTVRTPLLDLAATTSATPVAVHADVPFSLALRNLSPVADAHDADLAARLPDGWEYAPGSSRLGGAPIADPAVAGRDLTWAGVVASLPHGDRRTLELVARPRTRAAEVTGVGGAVRHELTARAAARDASGADRDVTATYADTAKAQAVLARPQADLRVAFGPLAGELAEGRTVRLPVTVANDGPGPALAPTARIVLPAGLGLLGVDGPGDVTCTGDPAACTMPSLEAGDARELEVRARVLADPPATLVATVDGDTTSDDPVAANDDDRATLTPLRPVLVLDQRVDGDGDADDRRPVEPGDALTFRLEVRNTGTSTAHDVRLRAIPDAALRDVVATAPGLTDDGPGDGDADLEWVLPTLAAGATAEVRYTARLASGAELRDGETPTSQADLLSAWEAAEADRDAQPGFAWTQHPPREDDVVLDVGTPHLQVVRTTAAAGDPERAPALIEQAFGWKVVVRNTGHGTAHGVRLDEVLPRNWRLEAGTARVDGVLRAPDAVDLGGPAGAQRLRFAGLGPIAPGHAVVVTYDAAPLPAAAIAPGTAVDHVSRSAATGRDASGAAGDADGAYAADDDARAELVVPVVDLRAGLTTTTAPVAGGLVRWTATLTNAGPETAPSARLRLPLPAGVDLVGARADRGDCTAPGGVVTCEAGELRTSAVVTVALTGRVRDTGAKGSTLHGRAEASDLAIQDLVPANDVAETDDVVGASADLSVADSIDVPPVAGRTAVLRLQAGNDGPSRATGVVVEERLPAGLSLRSVRGPGCTSAARHVRCAVGTLEPGEVADVVITAHVDALDGVLVRSFGVHGDEPDPAPAGDVAQAPAPVTRTDLRLTKSLAAGPLRLGRAARYLLVVENAGDAASAGPVTVTDRLPAGVTATAAGGDGWTCALGAEVVCRREDALAPGRAWPAVQLDVRVALDAPVPVVNVASLDGGGDVLAEGGTAEVVTVPGQSVDAGSCEPGGRLVLDARQVAVGVRRTVRATLTNRDGTPAVRVAVAAGGRTLRTDARGRVRFSVHAVRPGSVAVRAAACRLAATVRATAAASCRAVSVEPGELTAGRARRVRVRLRSGGRPVVGVLVALRGTGTSDRARTGRDGVARLRVTPGRPGIARLSSPAVACVKRVGVVDARPSGAQLTG